MALCLQLFSCCDSISDISTSEEYGSIHKSTKAIRGSMIRTCIWNYRSIKLIIGVRFSMKGMCVCVVGVHTGNTRRGGMMRNNKSHQLSDVRNNKCHW